MVSVLWKYRVVSECTFFNQRCCCFRSENSDALLYLKLWYSFYTRVEYQRLHENNLARRRQLYEPLSSKYVIGMQPRVKSMIRTYGKKVTTREESDMRFCYFRHFHSVGPSYIHSRPTMMGNELDSCAKCVAWDEAVAACQCIQLLFLAYYQETLAADFIKCIRIVWACEIGIAM